MVIALMEAGLRAVTQVPIAVCFRGRQVGDFEGRGFSRLQPRRKARPNFNGLG